jgi:hypothetical protein
MSKEKTRLVLTDKNGKKMFLRRQTLPSQVFSLYAEKGFKLDLLYLPRLLKNVKKAMKELYKGDGKYRMREKPVFYLKFPCLACGHVNTITFEQFKLNGVNCEFCGIVFTCGTQYG